MSISANSQILDAPVRGTGSVALLCELAGERGLTRRDVLAGTGIAEEALADPAAEITGAQEVQAIAGIAESLPEDAGLTAGQRYRLASYGIWGFALLSSRTLREGHEVAMRFVDLTYALTRVSAQECDGEVRLFFDDLDVPEHVRRFVLLRDTSAALQLWRETLGRPVVPLRVSLRLPQPTDPSPFETVFGVAPQFGAARSMLAFPAALLDQPLPQAAPLTAAICEAQCRELLQRRHSRRGTGGRVRDLLVHTGGRILGQEEVAAEMHVSVRTLRRMLRDEGTTFRAIVEETREHLAEELLVTARLSVEQVARRLGYTDPSTFVHAFRRWKGVSPGRWREGEARPPLTDVTRILGRTGVTATQAESPNGSRGHSGGADQPAADHRPASRIPPRPPLAPPPARSRPVDDPGRALSEDRPPAGWSAPSDVLPTPSPRRARRSSDSTAGTASRS